MCLNSIQASTPLERAKWEKIYLGLHTSCHTIIATCINIFYTARKRNLLQVKSTLQGRNKWMSHPECGLMKVLCTSVVIIVFLIVWIRLLTVSKIFFQGFHDHLKVKLLSEIQLVEYFVGDRLSINFVFSKCEKKEWWCMKVNIKYPQEWKKTATGRGLANCQLVPYHPLHLSASQTEKKIKKS